MCGDAGDETALSPPLSLQHFRVLGCLEDLAARTGAVSLEFLATLLKLAPATILRIVADLERAGLRVLGLR